MEIIELKEEETIRYLNGIKIISLELVVGNFEISVPDDLSYINVTKGGDSPNAFEVEWEGTGLSISFTKATMEYLSDDKVLVKFYKNGRDTPEMTCVVVKMDVIHIIREYNLSIFN